MVENEIALGLEQARVPRCVFIITDLLEKIQVSWRAFMIIAAPFVQKLFESVFENDVRSIQYRATIAMAQNHTMNE
jgi:hypothetical protein